jgi:hypothetical protein
MSYLIGHLGACHVTNEAGTVNLAPGVPIVELAAPEAAVLPSLVTDSDAILAPAVAGALPFSPNKKPTESGGAIRAASRSPSD